MEDDTWSFGFSAATTTSRGYGLKSQSDFYFDYEEDDGDDELSAEYPCPFCSEDFDLVGLCFHIDDQHPVEAKFGVCPVCVTRVGVNMVEHITTHHGDIFKGQLRLILHKSDPCRTRKELQDEHVESLLLGSSSVVSTSKTAADPLLSFIRNTSVADVAESVERDSFTDVSLEEQSSDNTVLESDTKPTPISDKDQVEKTQRCDFVKGLLLSTIFDDVL